MPLAPRSCIGPYLVLSPLGSGGMGEVYKARDPRLNRLVAVKLLAPHLREDGRTLARFQREARILASLSHPGIVEVFDVGDSEGVPYLVTELLEGETLAARLARGAVPREQALDWARQMAGALAAAHAKGVIHRDLKPANVMIGKEGRAKLLDFGLAKELHLDLESATGSSTLQGALLGTVGYMAPEQVRGDGATLQSDLFALGVLLLEMLTGNQAFTGDSAVDVLHAILRVDPLEGRDIPEDLRPVLARLLAKEPEARFESARDLAFLLGAPKVEITRPRKSRMAWAGLALALVVGAAAGIAIRPKPRALPIYSSVTQVPAAIRNARITPDGRFIAFSAEDADHRLRVHTFQEGRPFPEITDQVGTLLALAPDGELLYSRDPVASNPGAGISPGLMRWAGPGMAPVPVSAEGAEADLAPTGNTMAVIQVIFESGRRSFSLQCPPGRELYRSTQWLRNVRLNPQGDRIAFCENVHADGWVAKVVVVDLTGRERLRLGPVDAAGGLAWAPGGGFLYTRKDGRGGATVAHLRTDGTVTDVLRGPAPFHLMDLDARGRLLVLSESHPEGILFQEREGRWERINLALNPVDLSSSSDGRRFAFTAREANGQLSAYIHDLTQKCTSRVASDCRVTAMNADGTWVAVINTPDAKHERLLLRLVPTNGGAAVELDATGIGMLLGQLDIQPDRSVIGMTKAPDGTTRVVRLRAGAAPEWIDGLPQEPVQVWVLNSGYWVMQTFELGVFIALNGQPPWKPILALKDKLILGLDPASGEFAVTTRQDAIWEADPKLNDDFRARAVSRWRYTLEKDRLTPVPPLPTLRVGESIFLRGSGLPGQAVRLMRSTRGCLTLVDGALR